MEGISVKGAACQKIEDAPEMGKPEDNKSALHESSDKKESGMSSKPCRPLKSTSTLGIIAILFAAATVSTACKLPGGVTNRSKWEYPVFCLTNTFSFYSALSVFPILLLGRLNANFSVASVKASSKMLQLAVISMLVAYCSGRSLVLEGTWLVYFIRAMGVIGIVLMAFPSLIFAKTEQGNLIAGKCGK